MEAKEKAERLIKRFSTFLTYDQTISKEWHSPVDEEWGKIKRKNAIKLAIICAEEMKDLQLVKTLNVQLNLMKPLNERMNKLAEMLYPYWKDIENPDEHVNKLRDKVCEGCGSSINLSPVISDDNIYICEKCINENK